MKRICNLSIGILLLAICQFGCSTGGSQNETGSGKVTIYVVNYPLEYFAERIGGDHVDVVFPAPKHEDPAYWVPDDDVISAYQDADLILLNGADYAKWTKTASLSQSKTCDTSSSFANQYIRVKGETHSHSDGKTHSHSGLAFTTWIDPVLAIKQADTIRKKLSELRPSHSQTFQQNFESLRKDLKDLDNRIQAIVKQAPKSSVIFSHPVYQYLAREYKLNAKSVHWEPDVEATPKMLSELDRLLSKHQAKWMIWEGEPVADNVRMLEKRGVKSTVFDPCAKTPEKGDYLVVMRRNVDNLTQVFVKKK